MASFAARVNATYSASVDDKAKIACLLEHQLTGPPFSMKMKPDVDFLVAWSPAQSELEYPLMIRSPPSLPPYVIPRLQVPHDGFYGFSVLSRGIFGETAYHQGCKGDVRSSFHHREH